MRTYKHEEELYIIEKETHKANWPDQKQKTRRAKAANSSRKALINILVRSDASPKIVQSKLLKGLVSLLRAKAASTLKTLKMDLLREREDLLCRRLFLNLQV